MIIAAGLNWIMALMVFFFRQRKSTVNSSLLSSNEI